MNEHTIANLDDLEFEDELRENLTPQSEAGNWHLFEHATNVRRTQQILEQMQTKVETQLEKHGNQDEDWFRRANNFLRLVTMRLKQVNRVIHWLDGSATEREKKWRAFAHQLAEALENSDNDGMLDEIRIPIGQPRITAQEWLDVRRAKRAAEKAANPLDGLLDEALEVAA